MRLWINHETDSRGHGGNEFARAEIRWGSTKNSKLAGEIEVHWGAGQAAPIVFLKVGDSGKEVR